MNKQSNTTIRYCPRCGKSTTHFIYESNTWKCKECNTIYIKK